MIFLKKNSADIVYSLEVEKPKNKIPLQNMMEIYNITNYNIILLLHSYK